MRGRARIIIIRKKPALRAVVACVGARGMAVDFRSKVCRRLEVAALRIEARRTGEYLRALKSELLNLPRLKNTVDEGLNKKLILLSERFEGDAGAAAKENGWLESELEKAEEAPEATRHLLELGYEYFSVEEALRMVLPDEVQVPTSFEQAGHVIHLNLRSEHEPYKRRIAEVVLDKNPRCRTVVNKVGEISAQFRTFPLEVLAGDDDTNVQVKEHDCVFEFDFRQVYWNSRLQSEHARIVDVLKRASSQGRVLVADATAGVGPFAVPLARAGVPVRANDLNPHCVQALRANARRNRCGPSFLHVTGPGCARAFLRDRVSSSSSSQGNVIAAGSYTHAILNLPASGMELLDAFRGLEFTSEPPLVFCYCFAHKSPTLVADLADRLKAALGCPPPPPASDQPLPPAACRDAYVAAADHRKLSVRWVRNVAPNKDMYCLAFRVPSNAADLPPVLRPTETDNPPPAPAPAPAAAAAPNNPVFSEEEIHSQTPGERLAKDPKRPRLSSTPQVLRQPPADDLPPP